MTDPSTADPDPASTDPVRDVGGTDAADGNVAESASVDADGPGRTSARGRGRGLLGIVLGLLVLGGAGLLWASGMVWSVLTVERDEPLPPLAYSMSGSTAVPMTAAGGFIMLAAVVAVLATKTIGRRIIATIVLLTAAVTGTTMFQWAGKSAQEREATMLLDGVRHALDQAPDTSSLAVPLAVVSLVLGAAAAVVLLVTKNLALMSSKYERGSGAAEPATQRDDQDPQTRDRNLWSSLDRGEDPTS